MSAISYRARAMEAGPSAAGPDFRGSLGREEAETGSINGKGKQEFRKADVASPWIVNVRGGVRGLFLALVHPQCMVLTTS